MANGSEVVGECVVTEILGANQESSSEPVLLHANETVEYPNGTRAPGNWIDRAPPRSPRMWTATGTRRCVSSPR